MSYCDSLEDLCSHYCVATTRLFLCYVVCMWVSFKVHCFKRGQTYFLNSFLNYVSLQLNVFDIFLFQTHFSQFKDSNAHCLNWDCWSWNAGHPLISGFKSTKLIWKSNYYFSSGVMSLGVLRRLRPILLRFFQSTLNKIRSH